MRCLEEGFWLLQKRGLPSGESSVETCDNLTETFVRFASHYSRGRVVEGRVSRRAMIAVAVVMALIGGRLLVSRAIHPVAAARYGEGPVAAPRLGPKLAASENERSAASASSSLEMTSAGTSANAAESRNASSQPAVAEAEGVTDVDPHKAFGSKNAPIIMEVFSDFQCPACRTLFLTTNRQLMDNYVTTGKVYLIHRDFPLPMHAYSRVAARYARAAAEIGKVEPVEKALFENQEKWEQSGDVDGTVAAVLSSADMTKVRALVKGGTLDPLIDKDVQLGQMYRVSQTPTTVFHSKGQTYPYSSAMSYEILHQFLDQLLSQK
jgi:protein-disulfide isomerase